MCSADKLEGHDLLLEIIRAWSSSPVERQKGADVPLQSSGRVHQSKDGDWNVYSRSSC